MRPEQKIPTPDELRQMLWADRALEARYWAETNSLRGDPAYADVLAEARAWTEHVCEPDKYREFYAAHRAEQNAYVSPEAVRSIHERVPRLATIRRWVLEQSPKSILDLGCFDGFGLLNILAATGASGVGVDLDTDALAHAARSAKTLGIGAVFMESMLEDLDLYDRFDAVLMMEILEHVPDMRKALAVAEKHLAPGGRIYITVPASAVDHQGNTHEAREHLRVVTKDALLQAIGDRAVVAEAELKTTAHGERLLAYRRPRTAFYCNPVSGGWDPGDADSQGGSEEMVVGLATALAANGHEVEVFLNPNWDANVLDKRYSATGPTYRRHESWHPEHERDIVVAVKWPPVTDMMVNARRVLFWSADPNRKEDFLGLRGERYHTYVAISPWHKKELIANGLPEGQVHAFPLGAGADVLAADVPTHRTPTHVMYASSLDRGLERLLDVWPEVKAEVPEAELHVWYGWELFDKVANKWPEAEAWKQRVQEKIIGTSGVVFHGRARGADAVTMYTNAALWAYPCIGGERFCLTAAKAQRLGVVPVVTPVMALHDTVKYGLKCEQSDFAKALIFALKHPEWQEKERAKMLADPSVCHSWEQVAAMWHSLWREALGSAPTQPSRRRPSLKQQTLSACLITYNAENMLLRTLKSIRGVVDEIIVADQGSTDATLDMLARFPRVKVVEARSPHWCLQCEKIMPSTHYVDTDHEPYGFEGPRNDSIAPATCDWVLWIDTDEELVRSPNLDKYLRQNVFNGYAIRQHHFSIQPPNAFKPDLPVRCFRNGKGIRFFGKVHEHPEIKMNDGVTPACVLSDVDIAHDGYFVEDGRRVKFQRNIGLMHADRRFYPDRMLGKFLWLRDLLHLTRYDLEASGGLMTPDVRRKCEEAVQLYENSFLGEQTLYAAEGLDYYSEALRILNLGFEVVWMVGAAPHQAQPGEPRRARFSSVDMYKKALAAQADAAVSAFTGKYI